MTQPIEPKFTQIPVLTTLTRTTVVRTHTCVISAGLIRRMFDLPADAKITIGIPGGGDYSNMDLQVSDLRGGGIVATWTVEKVQEGDYRE